MIVNSLKIVSWLSLVILVMPSVLFLLEKLPLTSVHTLMTIATLLWFASRLGLSLIVAKNGDSTQI